jgi:hypothetical protein
LALLFMSACMSSALTGCAARNRPAQDLIVPVTDAPGAARAATGEVPELIDVRVLLVSYQGAKGAASDQTRTREQALERARMLRSITQGGERLQNLVPKYSDRVAANEDLGVVRLSTQKPLPENAPYVEPALALYVGAVSEPIEVPEGYALIERLKDPPSGPERVAARHILITYAGSPQRVSETTRTEAEARAIAEQVAAAAKQPGADWNALAAQYTDEPGSKETGGDLGKFGHGQMVPAFEKAAFALAVGEVSGVVQSPFGFHVITRYE